MQRRKRRTAMYVVTRSLIITALLAVVLLNLFTYVVQVVHYNGKGMEPSLRSGQLLVLHRTQKVEPGDIIAFYYNNQVLVRRVIAAENRQVTIQEDGTVLIDLQPLEEEYLESPSLGQCNLTFPYRVPSGCVFVLGDNRAVAMDSRLREIGPVPTDRIIGKLLLAL